METKRKYIIPAQRWVIMEENFLQSMSVKEEFADEEKGMDAKAEHNADGWNEGW